jgi:multiple sugar transport system substrate-binding protein
MRAVVEAPDCPGKKPYNKAFLKSMSIVKDFWAEPSYASLMLAMQARVHNYVIAGQGTAKEALDGLVKDWTEVFEDEGKL